MLETHELLTTHDMAKSLKIKPATIREWLRNGTICGKRIGKQWRIHPEELRRLADSTLPASKQTGT